jgi:hypothetical protein
MARAPVFVALLCLAAIALASGADARKMVGVYVLKKGDFSVKITNWGATIMSIVVPDSKGMLDDSPALMVALNFYFVHRVRLDLRCYFAGNLADVVLGMDTLAEVVVRPWVSLSIHSFFLVCILFLEYCASASYVSFFLSRFSVTS